MPVPTNCRYSESHEWTRKEGSLMVIGITDYAQHELGDVVFVELPPAGSTFKKGEAFGVIESVKAASDLFLPVGGEIVAVNDALGSDPALVNKDPHGEAWLVKVKPANPQEYDSLLDSAGYEAFIASEAAKH